MKIAFIGQKGIVTGDRGGGIETHVRELATRLAERGHDVTVYSRRAYVTKPHPKEYQGVTLCYIPTIYRKNIEAIVHTLLSSIDAIFKNFDIIHYHGVGPATLAWIPRLFSRNTKVVVTFHSQDRFHPKWSLLARLYLYFGEWASCKFPDATVTVSHIIQVYCRNKFKTQAVYIPNGAEVQDVKEFDRLSQFGLNKDGYILNVGRLVPQKGIQFLIDAYKQIKTDKKLVIVGAPGFSPEYLKLLEDKARGNNDITFLGFQTGETLRQLFAHTFLYCQPSEAEGLSISVLEAMSYGRCLLVSDIPENLEAMHHSGVSFKNTDVSDLTNKLTELIKNPDKVEKYGELAQKTVSERFNWEIICDHVEALFISLRH